MISDEKLFDDFIEDLNKLDPLQVILRGHLYIESRLIKLIELNLKHKEKLDLSRINFPTKIKLLAAMGVLDEYENELLFLNKIRNKLAHNLEYKVEAKEVEEFYNTFDEISQGVVMESQQKGDHLYVLRALISILYIKLESTVNKYETGEYLTDQF